MQNYVSNLLDFSNFKLADSKAPVAETKVSADKAPSEEKVAAECVRPADPKAPVDAFTPYECKHCQEKQAGRGKLVSQHGFTSREITMMISQLLRRDEAESGGLHCFCDKCLGVPT